ncbi:CGNR zinc finger domain-containing protein [Phyllobacterium sp. 0TCS1.6C]|uniref:CGNR zinc finger domain-containing protein n=1 Tax=unclassified Phyllobacterium TaxID=2638441 RepID=UPI002263BC4B|nr:MULTISPECIES: CGNR zinc finger domain-containing protein [unclassified Phyllobacterium]MCX8281027.1 CGNR zinc finger domain-containing protein [Phyllobacterium sp. 0TCS1.6C]MCX8295893.1 CGNR zinc finger domain-containing protein [Phyllobacterium sp. 0TCS1.6A]
MTFAWTEHRFSGGALALDLVNTVIYRQAPQRALDRFDDRVQMAAFAAAASRFRAEELGGARLRAPATEEQASRLIDLREAINRLFRDAVADEAYGAAHMASFLRLAANGVEEQPDARLRLAGGGNGDPGDLPLNVAAVLSAMRLLDQRRQSRIKICPNCHWLYLDQSRNRSRRWCDMAICGNRAKAKRHYSRRNADETGL